jgi:hypothetical protein
MLDTSGESVLTKLRVADEERKWTRGNGYEPKEVLREWIGDIRRELTHCSI